jgi:hypothetical protein
MNQQETELEQLESIPLGETAAALLSAALGCLTVSTTYRSITQFKLLSLKTVAQKFWLSYPIHQFAGFFVWLGSWAILYLVWMRRDLPLKPTIIIFSGILFLATAIAWKPIGDPIGNAIARSLFNG